MESSLAQALTQLVSLNIPQPFGFLLVAVIVYLWRENQKKDEKLLSFLEKTLTLGHVITSTSDKILAMVSDALEKK